MFISGQKRGVTPTIRERRRSAIEPVIGHLKEERRPPRPQHSQASLRDLVSRYGINPKAAAKWKKRSSAADLPTRPKAAKSTSPSV